tara:strand:+ start:484 stop:1074 length:591 start_codon:yes stop_codon:yes gene_type:complete
MDLACRTFKKVAAFYCYFVPGLPMMEDQFKAAEERWGIPIMQFPRGNFVDSLKHGDFCDAREELDGTPEFALKDVYGYFQKSTGIDLILTGAKDSDGIQRRQFFENVERQAKKGDTVWQYVGYPIKGWKKRDVISYLRAHEIPLPPAPEGTITSGIGLEPDCFCWLAEDYPVDWEVFNKWFPYADAVVQRRKLYGI